VLNDAVGIRRLAHQNSKHCVSWPVLQAPSASVRRSRDCK